MSITRDSSRRRFLQTSVAASAFFAAGKLSPTTHAKEKPITNLGVQLYTVRDLLPKDSYSTLKAIADLGYKEVEVIRESLTRIAPDIKRANLQPVSMHIEAALVTGNRDTLKAVAARYNFPPPADDYTLDSAIADAKKYGVRYLVVSYLFPPEREGGADFYRRFAAQMNRAGERCRAAGLTLGYHNHAFEFAPVDGVVPFDLLMKEFDPKAVKLEMDVFWIAMGGNDPAAMLRQHKGRVALVHLKDKAKGAVPEKQEGNVPKTAFAEVGNGELDFPAILRAARESGVEHYFVEQDQTPGNPLDSLRQSYAYLSKLNV